MTSQLSIPELAPAGNERFSEGDSVERHAGRKVGTAVLVCLSLALAVSGWLAMFTSWASYDDEGDWLIALRSFDLHGSLYHDTWSQCGPFYYEFWSTVFSVLGLNVDNQNGRMMTLAVWILTSAVVGAAMWMLTRRLVLGVLAEVLTFLVMVGLINEPMEPAGLACFGVAVAVFGIAVLVRGHPPTGAALASSAGTAALLTKVNIGVFAIAALLFAAIACWPTPRWRRSRLTVSAVVLLGTPVALMASVATHRWVDSYLAYELVCMASLVVIVAGAADPRPTRVQPRNAVLRSTVIWGIAAAVGLGLVTAVGVLLDGTSLSELVTGAFLSQRNLAQVWSYPLHIRAAQSRWAWGGLVCAAAYVGARHRKWPGLGLPTWAPGFVRLLVGGWICITLVGHVVLTQPWSNTYVPQPTFLWAAPFVWIAALSPAHRTRGSHIMAGRVALCALGLTETLQAFPSAGSQVSWSCLGLVPVGVLLLADGVEILRPATFASSPEMPSTERALVSFVRRSTPTCLLGLLLVTNVAQFNHVYWQSYDERVPVGLPGTESIRWSPSVVYDDRQVTAALKADCSTFVGLPGLNSFYFFTAEPPPTGLNTTQWMYLMDDRTQMRIVDAMQKQARPCVLENLSVLSFWQEGRPLPADSPLLNYIRSNFRPIDTIDDYIILVPAHPR